MKNICLCLLTFCLCVVANAQSHLIAAEEPGHEYLVAARSVLTADLNSTSIQTLHSLAVEIGKMIGNKKPINEEVVSLRKIAIYRLAADMGLNDNLTSGAESLYADWSADKYLKNHLPRLKATTLYRAIRETRCCAQYVPGQEEAIKIARALREGYPADGPKAMTGGDAKSADNELRIKELEAGIVKLKADMVTMKKALPLTK